MTLSTISYEIDAETRARWAERDEAEATRRKLQAAAFLDAAAKASNPAKAFTSQWKVLPEDREMIAKDMLSMDDREIYGRVEPSKKFPADSPKDPNPGEKGSTKEELPATTNFSSTALPPPLS